MNRRHAFFALAALPVAVVGRLFAGPPADEPYVCPLNGDVLPCPDCCPINGRAAAPQTEPTAGRASARAGTDCCSSGSDCCESR
jgi:hypothetical protein